MRIFPIPKRQKFWRQLAENGKRPGRTINRIVERINEQHERARLIEPDAAAASAFGGPVKLDFAVLADGVLSIRRRNMIDRFADRSADGPRGIFADDAEFAGR